MPPGRVIKTGIAAHLGFLGAEELHSEGHFVCGGKGGQGDVPLPQAGY